MATRNVHHEGNDAPSFGKANLIWEMQHRGNRTTLFCGGNRTEGSRKVTARASDGGSARSVVPARRRVQGHPTAIHADQQFFDKQPIVDDDIHYWSARSGSAIAARPVS